MKIVVIANNVLKQELMSGGVDEKLYIEWIKDINTISAGAAVYIDLLFDEDRIKRKQILDTTKAEIIIVNDVIETTKELPGNYTRKTPSCERNQSSSSTQ